MKILQIPVPDNLDYILGVEGQASLTREAGFLLATKLYESGRLSSGPCAEIAGVSKRDFILRLHLAGVPIVDWDEGEIHAEEEAQLK